MAHRLNETRPAKDCASLGFSCGREGLFLGDDYALIERQVADGGESYRLRPIDEINKALSAGYGVEVDLSTRLVTLRRIEGLLAKGDWGLAQINALHMKLPDLPDEQAAERLRKADQFVKFNANHKPAGPGGGQFATGAQDEASPQGVHASNSGAEPRGVPKLSYKTTSGGPNTPKWGIEFQLSKPSIAGGFIVQKIETHYVTDSGLKVNDSPFWEAFQVYPGQHHTRYVTEISAETASDKRPVGGGDDYWGGVLGAGQSHGVQTDVGTARFYEGLTKADLVKYGFAIASVGSIGGVSQYNTNKDPNLPLLHASDELVRISINNY